MTMWVHPSISSCPRLSSTSAGIHFLLRSLRRKRVDDRDKPGHDGAESAHLARGNAALAHTTAFDAHGRPVTTRMSEADAQSGAAADQGGVVGEAEILAGREQRHVPRLPFKAHAAK